MSDSPSRRLVRLLRVAPLVTRRAALSMRREVLISRGSERRLAADESLLHYLAHSIEDSFGQQRATDVVIPPVGADVNDR
jgi:hypothetical protein